jgi:hypothetical protein
MVASLASPAGRVARRVRSPLASIPSSSATWPGSRFQKLLDSSWTCRQPLPRWHSVSVTWCYWPPSYSPGLARRFSLTPYIRRDRSRRGDVLAVLSGRGRRYRPGLAERLMPYQPLDVQASWWLEHRAAKEEEN